jgi:hypothetical protein
MPGDKDEANSEAKTTLVAAAPAQNQAKSGAPSKTQKPSGDLSFVILLSEDLKKLAPNQLRERLLILIMKQVFSLSEREATAEINAIGWHWQSLPIPSPKEMATGLFKILIDKKSYNTTLTRLYGRSTQDTENNPATTLERIERFSNSAGDLSTLMPQRVLTGWVNQIYNSQHPQNQLDPTRETHYGNPVWEAILDRLLHEQQLLKGLRDEIKQALGGQGTFDLFPQYNQEFLRIARKLNKLSPEQIDNLKPLSLDRISLNLRLDSSARQDAYKQELDAYDRYVEQETKNFGINAAPGRTPGTASGQQTPQQTHQQSSEGLLTISLSLPLTPQSQQAFTNAIVAVTAVDAVTARQILTATIEGPNGQSWMKSRQILQNPDGKPYILVTVDTKQLPQTKVVRQDTPADPSGNSDGIGVNPPLLEVVPGTKVTYFYYPGNSLIDRDTVRYSWHVLNDPQSVKNRRERGLSAPEQVEGPNSPTWDARWDFPGLHTVVLRVHWPGGKITAYEYKQAVKEPQEILDRTFDQIPKYDYPGFRGGLEVKHLEIAQNGVSDQKFGTPHITSTAPNPAKAGRAPDYPSVTYSVVPSPNAKSYRWYVKPENWDWTNLAPNYNFNGYPRTQFQGQDVLSLESNSNSAKWLIASPGAYTIICEELDAAGQPLGTVARYLQVVQAAERLNQTEQFREYLGRVDSSIDKIAKDREGALRAVHLNTETSESTGLALFVGPDASDPKQIKLLDLTPGASRIEYGGADIEKAIDDFAGGNSYPKGLIKLEIPGGRDRTIETRGQSFLGGVASKSGWASLGLAGLGFAALVTPGGQVLVPYLFLGATVAGGVSSAASIANELQQAKPNALQIAIDVLGLASSLANGGAVFQALRGSGTEAAQSVAGRFLIYAEFTSDAVAGVLLTVESVGQINQIVNTEGMSRSEKVTALVRILSFLGINGGLIAYGAKDLPSGNSAKPRSGNNPLPNDSPPVKPQGPASFNPLPLDPKRLEELTNVLPEEWRSRVIIFADSAASGSAVRVYYQPDVAIGVGPAALAADIKLHIATVSLLLRYRGLLGTIRRLSENLFNWITRNREPRIGTVAWEAKLELQKLPQVIADRQARLSQTDDPNIRAQLEAEIASFEAQIDRHQTNLAQMNANPGKGFIAAEIDPQATNFFTIVEETSLQLTTTIEEILPNRPIENNMSDEQKNELKNLTDLRNKLLTRVETIAKRNTDLREAEKQLDPLAANLLESLEEIERKKERLVADMQKLRAELFKELRAGLTSNSTKLGGDGFREIVRWHQDILDTQELIELSPDLKETYAAHIQKQQENWLLTPVWAKQDTDQLYSLAKIDREKLAAIREQVANQLIKPRRQRLDAIKIRLQEIRPDRVRLTYKKGHLTRGNLDTSEVDKKLTDLTSEEIGLIAEENKLKNEIARIESLQNRIPPSQEVEKFAGDASVEQVWERLMGNHESGKESSTRKFANVLIQEKLVTNEQQMIEDLKDNISFQGRAVNDVRGQFKDRYRPRLLDRITDPNLNQQEQYQALRRVVDKLDSADKGNLTEKWYSVIYGQPDALTHLEITTANAAGQGITLTATEKRFVDRVEGDTIVEIKTISGKLASGGKDSRSELDQFDDNIALARKGYKITKKDGSKQQITKVRYVFTLPEGVKANREWMIDQIQKNRNIVSFEIFNNRGERKIIKNIGEAQQHLEEGVLANWLDSSN